MTDAKTFDLRIEGRALSDLLVNVLNCFHTHSTRLEYDGMTKRKQNVYNFCVFKNMTSNDETQSFEIIDYWDYRIKLNADVLILLTSPYTEIMILLDDFQKKSVLKYVGF
jgi:hypothetical protein